MMKVIQTITLDLKKWDTYLCRVYAKQGDSKSRCVCVRLTDDGKPYLPPAGTTAKTRCTKPDGHFCMTDAAVQADGSVMVELTEQMLAKDGLAMVDLVLLGEGGIRLSTATFAIQIERIPNGKALESSNEFMELQQGLDTLRKLEEAFGPKVEETIHSWVEQNPDVMVRDRSVTPEKLSPGLAGAYNYISLYDYGAKCDGITDDSDAFEAAVLAANRVQSPLKAWERAIYIPATVRITRKITIPFGKFRMFGNSLNNSRIFLDGENAEIEIGDPKTDTHEVELENLFFVGNNQNREILSFQHISNLYLHRVRVGNHGINTYAVTMRSCGIIYLDELIIEGVGNLEEGWTDRNGILVTGSMGSILNITRCNVWNLNRFLTLQKCKNVQKLVLQNNWIECVRTVLTSDSRKNNRGFSFSVDRNFISVHDVSLNQKKYMIPEAAIVDIETNPGDDYYGALFSLTNNNFYFWNTALKNQTMIRLDYVKPAAKASIVYSGNVFSGNTLTMMDSYVYRTPVKDSYREVWIRQAIVIEPEDQARLCPVSTSVRCASITAFGEQMFPRGIYVGGGSQRSEGSIAYNAGEFFGGYGGEVKAIPKNSGMHIDPANAGSELQTINQILTALERAHILA